MLGLVIGIAADFVVRLPRRSGGTLSVEGMSQHVEMDAEGIKAFLEGVPKIGDSRKSRSKAITNEWIEVGQQLLRYIFCGENANTSALGALELTCQFFGFQQRNTGWEMRYFLAERLLCPTPWSRRELAHEIRWMARQAKLQAVKIRITFVSSGTQFLFNELLPNGTEGEVGIAVVEALRAGVELELLFPAPAQTGKNLALQSAESFIGRLNESLRVNIKVLIWRGRQDPFFSRSFQWLMFSGVSTAPTLLLLRPTLDPTDDGDSLTIRASLAEQVEFKKTIDPIAKDPQTIVRFGRDFGSSGRLLDQEPASSAAEPRLPDAAAQNLTVDGGKNTQGESKNDATTR